MVVASHKNGLNERSQSHRSHCGETQYERQAWVCNSTTHCCELTENFMVTMHPPETAHSNAGTSQRRAHPQKLEERGKQGGGKRENRLEEVTSFGMLEDTYPTWLESR